MRGDSHKPNNNLPGIPSQIPKELEKLVPEKHTREKIIAIFTQHVRFWNGPLPSPDTLKEYDSIIPGLAERIIKMAETQSAHRIELEKKVVHSQLSESKRGQYFGLLIALISIGAAL